jgi:fatty acid desaturase
MTDTSRTENAPAVSAANAGLGLISAAVMFAAFLLAAAIGGGGRAIAVICVACGPVAALNLHHLARLSPLGRVIAVTLAIAAIVTAAACTIDLDRGGW